MRKTGIVKNVLIHLNEFSFEKFILSFIETLDFPRFPEFLTSQTVNFDEISSLRFMEARVSLLYIEMATDRLYFLLF